MVNYFCLIFFILVISRDFELAVSDTIKLCACDFSPCAGSCQVFNAEECQPFEQCFNELNGRFGYIYPKIQGDEAVVNVYVDANCTIEKFDPEYNGWRGFCDSNCWSTRSMVGADGCISSSSSSSSFSSLNVFSLYFLGALLFSIPH